MPTRWESSERPLFVKTVVVNGNRHAILSQVDPLCQLSVPQRKTEGFVHGSFNSVDLTREDMRCDLTVRRPRTCHPSQAGDISSDLQDCLVKLQVVLRTNTKKKSSATPERDEGQPDDRTHGQNWKQLRKKLNLDRVRATWKDAFLVNNNKEYDVTGFKRKNGNSVTLVSEEEDCCCTDETSRASETIITSKENLELAEDSEKLFERKNLIRTPPLTDSTEEILRNYSNYFFPIIYIKTEEGSWDGSGDEYVAKHFNNRLSERVLRWLDLARRRKQDADGAKSERESGDRNPKPSNVRRLIGEIRRSDNDSDKNVVRPRDGSAAAKHVSKLCEDVEEVRQECDVETVLSAETSQQEDCSRSSLLSIPEKNTSISDQLQRSILNSFEVIVKHDRRQRERSCLVRKPIPVGLRPKHARRNDLFMKHTSIRMSSDEDEQSDVRKPVRQHLKTNDSRRRRKPDKNREPQEGGLQIIYDQMGDCDGEKVWANDNGKAKPQLHIFMPDMSGPETPDESSSETENLTK